MLRLYTEPDKYAQLTALLHGAARNPSDGDACFNKTLTILNATNEIITLASSTGQPFVKGKRILYIHMAVTREGADIIAEMYRRVQKRLHDEWENGLQPVGVSMKPTAVQIRFNYYESHGLWFQAMTLQVNGVHTVQNQNYIIKLLSESF
jgi:hypothetical protein